MFGVEGIIGPFTNPEASSTVVKTNHGPKETLSCHQRPFVTFCSVNLERAELETLKFTKN